MYRRRLLAVLVATVVAFGQPHPPSRLDLAHVHVAPMKTSIYVGSVAMDMPAFDRHDGGFESTYVAKVFPFFFYNEQGRVRVEFTDAMLARLHAGEPVDFTGLARRLDGAERRIEGRATPAAASADSGKLKIRVFYSKRVELIFNTTYSFARRDPPSTP